MLLSLTSAANGTNVEDITFDGGASTFVGNIAGTALAVGTTASFTGSNSLLSNPDFDNFKRDNRGRHRDWDDAAKHRIHSCLSHQRVRIELGAGSLSRHHRQRSDDRRHPGGGRTASDRGHRLLGRRIVTRYHAASKPNSIWFLTSSHGTVAAQSMFAGPAGQIQTTQVFQTDNVKFNRVTWQNTTGIALNGSEANRTSVAHSRLVNIGNRWKGSGQNVDRQQAIVFLFGDGLKYNFNNTVTDTYFADTGLAPVLLNGVTGADISHNRMFIANGQGNLYPLFNG